MANALLIVDVQNFYLPDLPAGFAQQIVNHYQALNYDVVAFSVFKNSSQSNFVKSLKWTKCDSDEDARLPPEFAELANDSNTFARTAYSGFYNPALHEYLQLQKVDRLVICGVDTDACVLATAYTAFDLGYHVKVEFSLTHSGNDLQSAAEAIIRGSIASRD